MLPTVRDVDGLALSSRNAYLSAIERETARAIPEALSAAAGAFADGSDPVSAATAVLNAEPKLVADYVELAKFDDRLVLSLAARIGEVRLIDNVVLEGGKE